MCETNVTKDLLQNDRYTEGIVLPVNCYSDETYLTNFSGEKKTYRVNLTNGNIHSDIPSKLSQMTVILLALLPVEIKLAGTGTADKDNW